jgi:hypothetical protein
MAKDAPRTTDGTSPGECSTRIYSNATQTCGLGEPQPKCLQPGFQCVLAPYNSFEVKVGRCVQNGVNVLGLLPQNCGGGSPEIEGPGRGSCPHGSICMPPANARCRYPPPYCAGHCSEVRE